MALRRNFDPEPQSAQAVRRFVAQALSRSDRADDIVLVASELATNVIRHAHTAFTVQVKSDDDLIRLEVADGSSIIPAVEELNESKLGLRILRSMAEQWGVERTPTGKTVWAEFTYSSSPA